MQFDLKNWNIQKDILRFSNSGYCKKGDSRKTKKKKARLKPSFPLLISTPVDD